MLRSNAYNVHAMRCQVWEETDAGDAEDAAESGISALPLVGGLQPLKKLVGQSGSERTRLLKQ